MPRWQVPRQSTAGGARQGELLPGGAQRGKPRGATLDAAGLRNSDLRQAMLIDSLLDGANLTGAKLWETQRDGWSIKGVICQRPFWDRDGKELTEYGVGAFELRRKAAHRVALPGRYGAVDLMMLPLIIERLQADHPDWAPHPLAA